MAASLSELPKGLALEGNILKVNPPELALLPGPLRDVTVEGAGVRLVAELPDSAIEERLPVLGPGIQWKDGQVAIDLEAWSPGTRVREARIEDGALHLGLGEASAPRGRSDGVAAVSVRTEGRMSVQGFVLENADLSVRPPAGGALAMDKVTPADVTLHKGRILVTPTKLDALLRRSLGKDYDRMKPCLEDGRLVVRDGPLGLPLALRLEAGDDGLLKLRPASVLGNSRLLEVPQRLLGLLLTPVTALVPDDPRQSIDLAKLSGAGLPRLRDVEVTDEGIWLDFGGGPSRAPGGAVEAAPLVPKRRP